MELPSFYSVFLQKILRCRSIGCALLLLSLSPLTALGSTTHYSLLELKQEVAKFLAHHYAQVEHEQIDINVGNLDNRLRLSRCDGFLTITPQDPSGLGGNISVQAKCESGNKWSVHLPAQVMIYRNIPVAARTINRGELVQESHLASSLINISSVRQGFSFDSSSILGRETKRNINQGEPFKSSALDAPTAIKRGEQVTLQAMAGAIKVSIAGTAMADGRIGQKIRVRNNSSERIVSGVVMGQGLVQTL